MTINAHRSSAGFTLVEALVATALIAAAAVALAQLLAIGARQSTRNRDLLAALVAAQSKLEELRSINWSHSVAGADITLSPASSLVTDTPGHVDYAAPFVRRWAATRREPAAIDVVVIDVCVFAAGARAAAPEACVSTVRTRRP